jgi:CRP/FNR family cyclic AMP-dependent transcriptional regulator
MTTVPAAEDALPPALLERLAGHGNVRAFPAHAILINEGDQTDSLYIVIGGRVKLYSSADNGREIVLTVLTPGQYFGELSLDGAPRSLSAQSLEATRCCVIAGDQLRQFLAAEPDFALHLTHKLMRMVRRLTEQVKSLALQDVYGRVVRLLMDLSDESGQAGPERVLRDKLTQQDIADRVGSSREMVNRIMKELVAGGYVATDDKQRLVIRRKLPAAW